VCITLVTVVANLGSGCAIKPSNLKPETWKLGPQIFADKYRHKIQRAKVYQVSSGRRPAQEVGLKSKRCWHLLPSLPLSSHRSSRIPKLSARSAESSGIQQLSAIQQATAESIASKTHINEECVAQRHSRALSQNPLTHEELIEIAYRAAKELSDDQTANILKQLYGDGFEWGLST